MINLIVILYVMKSTFYKYNKISFVNITLPATRQNLKNNVLNRKSLIAERNPRLEIPFQVKNGLCNIIKNELKIQRNTHKDFLFLSDRPEYGIYYLFHLIDTKKTNYLNEEAMHHFLNGMNINLQNEDIKGLLRRLDINKDNKVSYIDFRNWFSPEKKTHFKAKILKEPPLSEIKPSKQVKHKYISPDTKAKKEEELIDFPRQLKGRIREPTEEFRPFSFNEFISKGSIIKEGDKKIPKKVVSEIQLKEPLKFVKEEIKDTPPRAIEPSPSTEMSPDKLELPEDLNIKKQKNHNLQTIMRQQLALEKDLEEAKLELCKQDDYSVEAAFSLFDKLDRETISIYEFSEVLKVHGINSTSTENIFKRYDLDRDGLLNKTEFTLMFEPISNYKNKSNNINTKANFSKNTEKLLGNLLETMIKTEEKSEKIKKRDNFSSEEALELFDCFEKRNNEDIDNYDVFILFNIFEYK